jgi:hypothetical protein
MEERERRHASERNLFGSRIEDLIDSIVDVLKTEDTALDSESTEDADLLGVLEEKVYYLLNEYEAMEMEE